MYFYPNIIGPIILCFYVIIGKPIYQKLSPGLQTCQISNMTSILPIHENEKHVEFLTSEAWQYLRPIFIFGRIFGASYLSRSKLHRILLRIHCVTSGLFTSFLFFRTLFFFNYGASKELASETVFKIIFLCSIIFGLICWGAALHFQRCLNDISAIIKPLITNGYRDVKPNHAKIQAARLFFLGLVSFANFGIMILAGFGYIPFAFYPYFYDFLISNKWILIFQTSLSTFILTGIQSFATSFQLTFVAFVWQVVQQFNERLADPKVSNSKELCSDYFLISKLKEHINRMWSMTIFLYDALFIVLLVVVAFLLLNHNEIETHTKLVLIFWIFVFFSFFLMFNIPAILLNEESEKTMKAVFQRDFVLREAKIFQSVSFLRV